MCEYQICTRCVMDTTDPEIVFDNQGVCSNCHRAAGLLSKVQLSEEESQRRLSVWKNKIQKHGRNSKYDCIIGLSGGVDSSYTALMASRLGLRPLAVHFDNGWNTEIAVHNIKMIVGVLGFNLETYVINWEEFQDLQRAYFKASVVDIEALTDHAITAAMFRLARKHRIRYILSGSNTATEHCMPKTWIWNKQDLVNIRAIHRLFGERRLRTFPMLSTWKYLVYRRTFFEFVTVLNDVNYRKLKAMEELKEELGWKEYGGKHYESLFTRFYQAHILPRKFGIDKRRAHLSSLIRNGEITRDQALAELEKPLYEPFELERDMEYVLKKLGFSKDEFEEIMRNDPVPHSHYPSDRTFVERLLRFYGVFLGRGLLTSKYH